MVGPVGIWSGVGPEPHVDPNDAPDPAREIDHPDAEGDGHHDQDDAAGHEEWAHA